MSQRPKGNLADLHFLFQVAIENAREQLGTIPPEGYSSAANRLHKQELLVKEPMGERYILSETGERFVRMMLGALREW